VPGAFVRTGNFYENMILRKYAGYDKERDFITMTRPIITEKAESEYDDANDRSPVLTGVFTTLYVEKDLGAVCKAIWDQWDNRKATLDGKYFLVSGARETPGAINKIIERGKSSMNLLPIY
jgi:hypothetical protein